MENRINILSSTCGVKTLNSMIFSGNGLGSYNRIYNYNKQFPTPTSNPITPTKPVINLSYYISATSFINNAVIIPTSNYNSTSSNESSYFSGRTTLYDTLTNLPCGTCGATFLSIKTPTNDSNTTPENIYTQISNYLTVDNGFVISWFTPSNPINLEIDSIINSMVTECIVTSTTKIGVNPYYGMTFNMVVSNNNDIITFTIKSIN
jgi:hypothetical protein